MADKKKKKGDRRAAKAAAKAEKESARAAAKAAAKRGDDDVKGDDAASEQSEKGANMMAAGEVMINDSFFDGESKTVSLSGASLAALPGSKQPNVTSEVTVEDIDDS
eukprot:3131105-Prymnesium_polylepis.1